MKDETEAIWDLHDDKGFLIGLPKGYFKIGITLGVNYSPPAPLIAFLNELHDLSSKDSSLLLIPPQCHHFTFLALAPHIYESIEDLSDEISQLKKIILPHLQGLKWEISNLQLVPGQSVLLLAGLPNQEAIVTRKALAENLKSSFWKNKIAERYKNGPCPPTIWHTTICRSKHERLSSPLRQLFKKYKNVDFGNIELGTPALKAVNFDWSFSHTL